MYNEMFDITTGQFPEQKAVLKTYLHSYSPSIRVEDRPLVLILPGGGYAYKSDREAEPIALAFMAQGFHAAVLDYSSADYSLDTQHDGAFLKFSVEPAARLEVAEAVSLLHRNAGEWHIDESKIVLWGASAGGHLAAHYACTWYDELSSMTGKSREELRIGGLMLAYPVISSGEKAHRRSFENLLRDKKDDPVVLARVSLEKRVNEHVPPVFLWHTWTDGSVPVENSLLFAQALKEHGINTEMHIFPTGGHGLALADERTVSRNGSEIEPCCQIWIELACSWLKRLKG
ncbi:MAG: alpha/beta hydrolase [Lachnospiraceae bacterium]|nr:alpha/beta hydrolase [Lachnospiraceae bacterium]